MIGNDVVDLADPETQRQQLHPRFDERILSPEEQRRLSSSDSPHCLRWILWAAKEASYKRGRKLYSDLIFSPRRFETQLTHHGDIEVRHPQFTSTVKIQQNDQHVHAIALPSPCHTMTDPTKNQRTTTALLRLQQPPTRKPSQETHRFARRYLAHYLKLDWRHLKIVNEQKIPYLMSANQKILGDLSLSHHGRFLALAFQPCTPAKPLALLS